MVPRRRSLTPLFHTRAPGQTDEVFKYDKQGQQDQLKARPWKQDPHHFKKVRISAVALIKMVRLPLLLVPVHST